MKIPRLQERLAQILPACSVLQEQEASTQLGLWHAVGWHPNCPMLLSCVVELTGRALTASMDSSGDAHQHGDFTFNFGVRSGEETPLSKAHTSSASFSYIRAALGLLCTAGQEHPSSGCLSNKRSVQIISGSTFMGEES